MINDPTGAVTVQQSLLGRVMPLDSSTLAEEAHPVVDVNNVPAYDN